MKKLMALILALVMCFSVIPAGAEITGIDITVYISVSQYGEIVKDKNDNLMAYAPITLTGKESYNLDDVFLAAHSEYFINGEEGYQSAESDWGPYVLKLWGDESGNFGYQVNGGEESVSGLGFEVQNGDYIDACIYKNLYPDTEGYARFDTNEKTIYQGDEIEFLLTYVSGYDDNWNSIFSPCEDAEITINGEATEIKTNEEGKAVLTFGEQGEYIISAVKSKELNEKTVPAITAPVCKVTVQPPREICIIHNIAEGYKNIDIESAGGNLPWIVSDMAVYEEIFPESDNHMTSEKKEEIIKKIASEASTLEKPGDIAKNVLAVRALGYDAGNIYTEKFEKVNMVSKLTALVDSGDDAVTNIYTLPYVIIALSQHSSYATAEQMTHLIKSALESSEQWLNTEDGTDAMTPMILALMPYYNAIDGVKSVIDIAAEKLKNEQRADGLIDGFEGYESASTGLAIAALSAMGVNSKEVAKEGENLIAGLISTANESLSAFPNPFATEQGFRGLLSWQLLVQNKGKNMYDFSGNSMDELNVSGAEYLPVIFNVTPSGAKIEVTGAREISGNCFDANEGSFAYKVSASGYKELNDTFVVTAEELEIRKPKVITVSLEAVYYGGGGGGAASSVKVDKNDKEEKQEEKKEEAENKEENKNEEIKNVFTDKTFSDVSPENWYYNSVKYVYENNLFSGTDIGFEPDVAMSRAMLTTVLHRLSKNEEEAEKAPFEDVTDDMWYSSGINWAYKNKIVNGMSDVSFNPDEKITREQLALIIYNYACFEGYDVTVSENISLLEYNDCDKVSDWAHKAMKYLVATGIINGKGEKLLAPGDGATRAEVATIIMRFTEMNKNEN